MDEMRELLRRLDLDLLEPSDSEKIKVFLAGVIADAEAEGLERISLVLEDEVPEA
jgi:hypothetical protein